MNKWYEDPSVDETPVISSRVRLARNVASYPFPIMMDDETAEGMIEEVKSAVRQSPDYDTLDYLNLNNAAALDRRVLLERHVISRAFFTSGRRIGLLTGRDDGLNVMLNEEDHIRMQSVCAGVALDEALIRAYALDDAIEERVEYAFDSDFGYLTSCPTNTGTGMRASFMVHIPFLEKTGQLKNVVQALTKFGMTVRGIYGEGTESQGSVYQISNQLTLGKSEEEIITALKNVTQQVVDRERSLLDNAVSSDRLAIEDSICRSYGLLTNCRKISAKEAMNLLSNVRIGFMAGLLNAKRPKSTIYDAMISIQPGSLSRACGRELDEGKRDELRAEFIRKTLEA